MQYRDAYGTLHYHYISLLLPYPLTHHARLININTNGLITAYMHQYCDTGPTPSQRQALGHDTNHPVMVILAHCSICTAQHQHLRFHMATTSRSGPSGSILTQHRDCSSPPWFAQPLAMEYQSFQYWSFSRTQGMVSGRLYLSLLLDLLSWQVGSSSLQDEVC
jgi:hypothetical protein